MDNVARMPDSDSFAAYLAEIRAVEDNWIANQLRSKNGPISGSSVWTASPARYGIQLNDPRVYSIAAYQDEVRAIEDDWRSLRHKNQGDPQWEEPDSAEFRAAYSRFRARTDSCKARYFPGLNGLRSQTIDSIPKLWAYITLRLRRGIQQAARTAGLPDRQAIWNRGLRRIYYIVHRLKATWAPRPPYRTFTQEEAEDELTRITNLLEQEDTQQLIEWQKQAGEEELSPQESGDRDDQTVSRQAEGVGGSNKQAREEAENNGGKEVRQEEILIGDKQGKGIGEVTKPRELKAREKETLSALLLLKADGKNRRVPRWKAAKKVDPECEPSSYNAAIASLVECGLVCSRKGPGGGIWLSPEGALKALKEQRRLELEENPNRCNGCAHLLQPISHLFTL